MADEVLSETLLLKRFRVTARTVAWAFCGTLLGGALLLFPLLGLNPFILTLVIQGLIHGIWALSLDLLVGQTGLVSFGHAAWYGLGAYLAGWVAIHVTPEITVGMVIAVVGSAILSLMAGIVITRLSGIAFAILTLATSQLMYNVVFKLSWITGGEDGMSGVPPPRVFGHRLDFGAQFYWLTLFVLGVSMLLTWHLARTPMGRAWNAIRENERRAAFVGIRVSTQKLIVFAVSAALGSVAGVLQAYFRGAVSPEIMYWATSGQVLMYVIVGGVGTLVGPVVGAVFFIIVEHYVSSWAPEAWQVIFGALFMLVVVGVPGGFGGLVRKFLWKRKGK